MQHLPILKPGDEVEIIAPASRCKDEQLQDLINLLSAWSLKITIPEDLFGKDLLCANTDEKRFRFLKNALLNPHSKAIIGARGGYGCNRLMPELLQLKAKKTPKIMIGMSDMTMLNIYLQQHWHWPIIHGAPATDKFSQESISYLKALLFGEKEKIEFVGIPLNKAGEQNILLESTIIGGNLSLIQTSIGTPWQINAADKMIFLEEVGERGYRIDRMLMHLKQAHIFNCVRAIIFGDFIGGQEPNGSSLLHSVIERFASSFDIPVVKISGVGHDHINYPMPMGTLAQLHLGKKIQLTCFA